MARYTVHAPSEGPCVPQRSCPLWETLVVSQDLQVLTLPAQCRRRSEHALLTKVPLSVGTDQVNSAIHQRGPDSVLQETLVGNARHPFQTLLESRSGLAKVNRSAAA